MELRSESISADSMEELRRIFDQCDEYNQGFIPVSNFIQVFKGFISPSQDIDIPKRTSRGSSPELVEEDGGGGKSKLSSEEEEELIKFFDPDADGLMSFADFLKGVEILRSKEAAEKSGDTTYESCSSNDSKSDQGHGDSFCEVSLFRMLLITD